MKAKLIAILLLTGMLAQPSHAGTPPDAAVAAKQAYQLGARLYGSEKFSAAAEAFLEAYRLQPNPMILYNVAQAYRKDGRFPEALTHYERFLKESQPAQRANVEAEARQYIDEIKAYLGSQKTLLDRQTPPPPEPTPPVKPELTPHPEPAPAATAAPAATVEAVAKPHPTPISRRWYLWTPIAVVVVGVGIGIGLGVGLKPSDPALGTFNPVYVGR